VLDRRGQLDEMRVLRRAVITDVTAARGGVEERV
jgi:hypothetical protein